MKRKAKKGIGRKDESTRHERGREECEKRQSKTMAARGRERLQSKSTPANYFRRPFIFHHNTFYSFIPTTPLPSSCTLLPLSFLPPVTFTLLAPFLALKLHPAYATETCRGLVVTTITWYTGSLTSHRSRPRISPCHP